MEENVQEDQDHGTSDHPQTDGEVAVENELHEEESVDYVDVSDDENLRQDESEDDVEDEEDELEDEEVPDPDDGDETEHDSEDPAQDVDVAGDHLGPFSNITVDDLMSLSNIIKTLLDAKALYAVQKSETGIILSSRVSRHRDRIYVYSLVPESPRSRFTVQVSILWLFLSLPV